MQWHKTTINLFCSYILWIGKTGGGRDELSLLHSVWDLNWEHLNGGGQESSKGFCITSLVLVLKAGLSWNASRSPYLTAPPCGLGFITAFWPQVSYTSLTQQLRAPRPSVLTNKAEAAGLPRGRSHITSLLPSVG